MGNLTRRRVIIGSGVVLGVIEVPLIGMRFWSLRTYDPKKPRSRPKDCLMTHGHRAGAA